MARIRGTRRDEHLTGSDGSDLIYGGHDYIWGAGIDDELHGGRGYDVSLPTFPKARGAD